MEQVKTGVNFNGSSRLPLEARKRGSLRERPSGLFFVGPEI
jgi:hypothetical protein